MARDIAVVIIAGVAFLGVLVLSIRFLAPIAGTREGAVATWLSRGLIAAAATVVVLRLYEAGRAVRLALEDTTPGIDVPSTVSVQVAQALFEGGVLLGLAAGVYLLARQAGTRDRA